MAGLLFTFLPTLSTPSYSPHLVPPSPGLISYKYCAVQKALSHPMFAYYRKNVTVLLLVLTANDHADLLT